MKLLVSIATSDLIQLTIFLLHLKIVYTLSKSDVSIFLTFTDLSSKKHQTNAEVDDAFDVCQDAMKTYNTNIASIPVDNAARDVAVQVVSRLAEFMPVFVSRDPAHCIDLLLKDLA